MIFIKERTVLTMARGKKIEVLVNEEVYNKILEIAKDNMLNKSDVVKMAISAYLKNQELAI